MPIFPENTKSSQVLLIKSKSADIFKAFTLLLELIFQKLIAVVKKIINRHQGEYPDAGWEIYLPAANF
ncbi:MAG: hypothetical protein CVV01_01145 [Firmicutes bacterium HGW-Firmicutes-6]|nr:MAG: hypothetical protein CVV01_01145 [Firmicutes bacterium HGW-Firmicutes-6]